MGFETTTPWVERAKIVHALERAVTVMDAQNYMFVKLGLSTVDMTVIKEYESH
jgi:hypothetical protein